MLSIFDIFSPCSGRMCQADALQSFHSRSTDQVKNTQHADRQPIGRCLFLGLCDTNRKLFFQSSLASSVLENREQVTFASALLNFLFFQKFLFSSLICVELDSDLVLLNFSRMKEPFFSYQRKGGSIKSQVDQLSLYVRIKIQG